MATSATTTGTTNPLSNVASSFTPTSGAMTGKSETLSEWAGPYVTDLLGKVKAMSAEPYQVYGGPLTAGASELQQKYFQGLGQMGFPSQLGKTFSAEGAPTLPTMTATGMTGGATQPTGIAAEAKMHQQSEALGKPDKESQTEPEPCPTSR